MDDDRPIIGLELESLLSGFEDYPTNPKHFNYGTMCSPMDVVQRERLLAQLEGELVLGEAVPSDVLVFGYDDDNGPASTKVGGTPYRPRDESWPIAADGSAMEFLAQFNFSQSRDLLPSLPGELLSVFVYQRHFTMQEFRCEWRFLIDGIERVGETDIPEIVEPMVATPAFAVPCRMSDYPNARVRLGASAERWESFTTMRASKIGGTPKFFRPPELPMSGEFLCALHSLRHGVHVPWPFLNVEEPLTPQMLGGIGVGCGRGCHDTVMFGSEGGLYFYLQEDGSVRIRLQCWSCEEDLPVS